MAFIRNKIGKKGGGGDGIGFQKKGGYLLPGEVIVNFMERCSFFPQWREAR